jgi:plastocyanin
MVGEILVRDASGNVPERVAAVAPAADTVPVQIINFAFAPASASVPVGGTVAWTNDDGAPHTATALDGSFDSGILDPGGAFSWTFESPGTFAYQCALHPQMQGEVVVTGDAPVESAQTAAGAAAEATPPATPVATPTAAGTPAGGSASVAIVDLAFEPPAMTVPVGAEVVWTNTGQLPHTVTADSFSSEVLETGQEFRHTFTEAGIFDYICALHPEMSGQVTVE